MPDNLEQALDQITSGDREIAEYTLHQLIGSADYDRNPIKQRIVRAGFERLYPGRRHSNGTITNT